MITPELTTVRLQVNILSLHGKIIAMSLQGYFILFWNSSMA